eukprot:1826294-Prymnesium_polylepis.1
MPPPRSRSPSNTLEVAWEAEGVRAEGWAWLGCGRWAQRGGRGLDVGAGRGEQRAARWEGRAGSTESGTVGRGVRVGCAGGGPRFGRRIAWTARAGTIWALRARYASALRA